MMKKFLHLLGCRLALLCISFSGLLQGQINPQTPVSVQKLSPKAEFKAAAKIPARPKAGTKTSVTEHAALKRESASRIRQQNPLHPNVASFRSLRGEMKIQPTEVQERKSVEKRNSGRGGKEYDTIALDNGGTAKVERVSIRSEMSKIKTGENALFPEKLPLQGINFTGGIFSFQFPPKVSTSAISAWGAGGAGGAVNNSNGKKAGGGGGGGAFAQSEIVVGNGTTYNGSAGIGGNSNGPDTTWQTNVVLAKGGTAGGTGSTTADGAGGIGGPVAGSIGTTKYSGGSGAAGSRSGSYSGGGGGSAGQQSTGGNASGQAGGSAGTGTPGGAVGTNGYSTNGPGGLGTIPGSGGSGAYRVSGTASPAGGNGAHGRVLIKYDGYCRPLSGNAGTYINALSTTNGVVNILKTATGYGAYGYQNFYYDPNGTVSVASGNTFDLSFNLVAGSLGAGVAIWIDWNNDNVFDSTELIVTSNGYIGSDGYLVTNIQVPPAQATGDYVVRIVTDYWSANPDPCSLADSGARGEGEDYKLTVLAPVSCNPVTATASKYSLCSGDAVTLSATSSTTGYTYTWFTDWDNETHTGTLVGTGASVTVNPTVSTLYGVVATKAGCPTGFNAAYALLTVSVAPPPTIIVMDPIAAITCSDEVRQVSVVGGGIIPETILNETFNPTSNPWITSAQVTGSNLSQAQWMLYNDGSTNYSGNETFHSNDNSTFAMVDSDRSGYFNSPDMKTSLISPPLNFTDYNSSTTQITLSFYHYFRQYLNSDAYVEITTDGSSWTPLRHYTSTVGGSTSFVQEIISLTPYKGQPYIQIRFKYTAYDDWYWALDNINITGTNPLPTTVTWSPTTGLWRDAAKTVAYDGAQATTLYASPASTTTYTVSAKTAAGCPSTQTVVVTKGDTDWSGTTTNWNTASNWEGNTVPTADHCVNIPNSTVRPVISAGTEAHAKNLTIQPGGSLDIKGNLTVQNFVKNLGDKRALILSSDANLLQLNAVAANSGEITAHREITIKDNNQYNYLISPLIDSNLKTNIYENKTTGVLSSSQFTLYHNEGNNKFYTSSGAYIRGRGLAVKEPSASVVPPGGKIYAHFTGVPMNGDFTYTLANSGTPTTGYNLIGNPYPSNIDIKKLYDDSPGQINENFEFWDNLANAITVQQGSEYKGAAYAIFNAATGTYGVGNPAPGNTEVDPNNPASPAGSKIPNHIVKVGQGFMVRAIGAGVLNFKNTQRTKDQTDSNFYGRNQTVLTDDRYWLQLTTPSDMVISNAIVYFDSGNNEFSKDDSKETGTSDALFTYAGTEKVVINGRNKFNIDDIIDIGTRNYTAGINKIALGRKEGVFATSQPIYLRDNQTGTITNLSEGAYTFMAQAGESTGRFEIVYKSGGVLATDAAVKEDIVVYRDGQVFVVKAQRDPVSSVEIFDAAGRMVRRVEPNSTVARLDFSAIINGTYILKIDQKGKITVKKVIK